MFYYLDVSFLVGQVSPNANQTHTHTHGAALLSTFLQVIVSNVLEILKRVLVHAVPRSNKILKTVCFVWISTVLKAGERL
jgi:hypothetical protein